MSHEDTDPPEAPSAPEVNGRITWQVLVSGALVACLMGAAYPYMVLRLGFGPNVSVVAAFFGFCFALSTYVRMPAR